MKEQTNLMIEKYARYKANVTQFRIVLWVDEEMSRP